MKNTKFSSTVSIYNYAPSRNLSTIDHVTHERKKVIAPPSLPYIHNISHNLKKIGKRVSVDIALSAPLKLSSLRAGVNADVRKPRGCYKKHRDTICDLCRGCSIFYSAHMWQRVCRPDMQLHERSLAGAPVQRRKTRLVRPPRCALCTSRLQATVQPRAFPSQKF